MESPARPKDNAEEVAARTRRAEAELSALNNVPNDVREALLGQYEAAAGLGAALSIDTSEIGEYRELDQYTADPISVTVLGVDGKLTLEGRKWIERQWPTGADVKADMEAVAEREAEASKKRGKIAARRGGRWTDRMANAGLASADEGGSYESGLENALNIDDIGN